MTLSIQHLGYGYSYFHQVVTPKHQQTLRLSYTAANCGDLPSLQEINYSGVATVNILHSSLPRVTECFTAIRLYCASNLINCHRYCGQKRSIFHMILRRIHLSGYSLAIRNDHAQVTAQLYRSWWLGSPSLRLFCKRSIRCWSAASSACKAHWLVPVNCLVKVTWLVNLRTLANNLMGSLFGIVCDWV